MGKFDGYLICTDWDGSFASGKNVSPRNVEAVRYFQENGGLFTVATGRYAAHIGGFYQYVVPNTYLITLNGSAIVDPKTGEYLSRHWVKEDFYPILDRILARCRYPVNLAFYPLDGNQSVPYTVEEYREHKAELAKTPSYKVLFVTDLPEHGEELRDIAREETAGSAYESARSWPVGLEFFSIAGNKGNGVLSLKAAVGAKCLVCIGDFENDLSMLKVADLPCAVANAIPEVKATAKYVASVTAAEGAVAEMIGMIEEKLL